MPWLRMAWHAYGFLTLQGADEAVHSLEEDHHPADRQAYAIELLRQGSGKGVAAGRLFAASDTRGTRRNLP